MAKYNNKKVTYDGIKFDSIREKNRYIELKLLERAGEIKDLKLQPIFELQPKYKKGKNIRSSIKYIADFQYFDIRENKTVIEDVKGVRTPVYNLKKKIFEYVYPDSEIKEV